jgi:hypothetical protein
MKSRTSTGFSEEAGLQSGSLFGSSGTGLAAAAPAGGVDAALPAGAAVEVLKGRRKAADRATRLSARSMSASGPVSETAKHVTDENHSIVLCTLY